MMKRITVPPNVARRIISLRPNRSANPPQMGETIIMVKACPEYTNAERSSMLKPEVEPRFSTKRGRKGKMLENPTTEMSWLNARI